MPDLEAKCFHGCLASILCECSSSILSAQYYGGVLGTNPTDVARERNVKDVEESSHFKLLRPKITAGELQQCKQRCEEEAIKEREREQERGGNEKVRDCEEEKRILGKSSRSAVNSAKNQNSASNPSVKGSNMREDREEKKRKSTEEAEKAQKKEAENMRSNRGKIPATSIQRLKSQFRSQNGHLRVLERFSKQSELLRDLENYRFAIIEVQPICLLRPEIAGVDIYPGSAVAVQTGNSAWKHAGHVTGVMGSSTPSALVQAVHSHTGNAAVHSTKAHPAHHRVLRNVLGGGRVP
ncbi:hypothetical protein OIU77_014467 [Salix suchowensis]|uniref:Uncharacterized protein n=1 Tax=Salix suchowensis TaxID=1278906 RepID=A0ABQ8ZY69_9ROSI|nr:hypothetical protein OIU77_014467 [Salix suchowensis]